MLRDARFRRMRMRRLAPRHEVVSGSAFYESWHQGETIRAPRSGSGMPAMAAFVGSARNVGPAAGTLDRILDNDLAGAERGIGRRTRCGWRWRGRWRAPCRFIRIADKAIVQAPPAGKGLPHRIDGDAEQDDFQQKSHRPLVLSRRRRVKSPLRVGGQRPLWSAHEWK